MATNPLDAPCRAGRWHGFRHALPPVVFSAALLACAWVPASAQDVPSVGSTPPVTVASGQNADSHVPIGTVRQPTLDDPGWVTGITLGELYTDNLKLAPSGSPKQDSWITQIEPFIKAAYSGAHFSGLVDYSLTGYLYAKHSSYDQLTQDLKAQGTYTLMPRHLFVDGKAMYGSAVINNQLSAARGTYFLTNNRANVARGTVSPYWVQGLGNVATMKLLYSVGRVVYNTRGISNENPNVLSGIPNVTSRALQYSLVSPQERTWGWDLEYSNQRIKPAHRESVKFGRAKLGTYLQISDDTRLLADGGKESRFLPDGTVDTLGAKFWDAGFAWANSRNRLKALVGHRFYGRSYQFSWVRTAALLTTTVRYVERPTDLNQQLLAQNPGQVIVSPSGLSFIPSLAERRIYLMKRATLSANYQMPKGNLRVTLYNEHRDYFAFNNAKEKITNAHVDWMFEIGAFTTLTPVLGWQRYQHLDGQIMHDTYEQLALVHQYSPKDFASLKVRHDSRSVSSATPGAVGYGVNVIFLQWTHLF